MKRNSLIGLAVLMVVSIMAVPVMAAPVDLRSTMQFDQSLNADIVVPELKIVSPDNGAVQVIGARSIASASCLSLDSGLTIASLEAHATGSEVAGLSVGQRASSMEVAFYLRS